jgi:hypothetical protein
LLLEAREASGKKRREFITLFGGAAAWPLSVRAQQAGKVWRIGILTGASPSDFSQLGAAFVQGMRELGYVKGFVVETRSVEGKYPRLPVNVVSRSPDHPDRAPRCPNSNAFCCNANVRFWH